MDKITFCIPVKSNLRYLKTCIPSLRENAFRKDHDIVIYVDQDTDGTLMWLRENKEKYNLKYIVNENINRELKGIALGYNYTIEAAETDVVMIFHADMYLGKNADLEAFRHLTRSTVVCSTRIEPPLHPPGPEKIVQDFGMWPEEDQGFQKEKLDAFIDNAITQNDGKTTNGCFAPWMIHKDTIVGIGGNDSIFHSYHEDSDLFMRLKIHGLTLVQSWTSFVYHLTCRGGVK